MAEAALAVHAAPSHGARFVRKYPPLVIAAAAFVLFTLLLALAADWLAPFHYTTQDLAHRLQPPSFLGGPAQYWLGTDELGRDLLSRLIYATRYSILIAVDGTTHLPGPITAITASASSTNGNESMMLTAVEISQSIQRR